MKKVCIITCYSQPDYVRAKTLRSAISSMDDMQLIIVKNKSHGIGRYFEVLIRTIAVRMRYRPDVYILTFRGYELLLPMRILTFGKPFIFDEFINLVEWVVYEHKKLRQNSLPAIALTAAYRLCLRAVDGILTDTQSHAELSSELMKIPMSKYYPVVVSTDEDVFKSIQSETRDMFTVIYYGNMLPLHGLKYVIEAARSLRDMPIRFVLIGGNRQTEGAVEDAIKEGAAIDYKRWVDFSELPGLMANAHLCLAGPFGGTFQAQYVITGKEYQYLSMKRPTVIGTNKESVAFANKKNAIIVEQGSAKALEDAIRWAYDHQEELGHIAESGYELYKKEFSNSVVAQQLKLALTASDIK